MNQLTKTCCEFCGKPESHNVSHDCSRIFIRNNQRNKMKKRKTIWYFNKGKAAKYEGDKNIKPSMGFSWFFWFPRAKWNGGSLFRKEVFDFGINWLCYWVGITIYGNQNIDHGQSDSVGITFLSPKA